MTAASSTPRLNAHVIAGCLVALAVMAGFCAIAFFGEADRAEAVGRLTLASVEEPPPAPPQETDPAPDHAPSAHEAIVMLRPSDDPHGPRLPGVDALPSRPPAASHASEDAEPRHAPTEPSQTAVSARADGLPRAPFEALTTPGPGGVLPAIAADGRRALTAYARPALADGRPRIAVIVGGLGLSRDATQAAIDTLPADVTLGFVPYAEGLQEWIDAARAAGHEVVLELPMEPFDYPANDPGPHTLLADAPAAENGRRLDWLMSRAAGYFAVMNYQGARFATSETALRPTLARLRDRGVALVFDGESTRTVIDAAAARAHLPFARADRILDVQPARDAIDEQLLHLEALAIQNGDALGVASARPVSIEQIREWARTLEAKGYALAPASAVLSARAEARAHAPLSPHSNPNAPIATRTFATVQASYDERGEGEDGDSHGGSHH